MNIYLDKIIISSDDIESVQLIVHNNLTLLNTYLDVSYETACKFCLNLKDKAIFHGITFNGNDVEFSKGVEVVQVAHGSYVRKGVIQEKSIKSVYGLLWNLAIESALFIPSEDYYENGYKGVISSFSDLRVSESTMSILMSYYDYKELHWKSVKLIAADEDGILKQHSFMCAVEKSNTQKYLQMGLQMVCDSVDLNNKEYVILKYERNLSIYRRDVALFPKSVVIDYQNQIERFQFTTKLLDYSFKRLRDELNVHSEELPVINKSSNTLFNNTMGVFIKSTRKKLKQADFVNVYNSCLALRKMFMEKGIAPNLTKDSVRQFCLKMGLDNVCFNGVEILLDIIMGKELDIELLDCIGNNLMNARLIKLSLCLYMYSLRVQIYQDPSVLGNAIEEGNIMYFDSYEGAIRMEVWK